VAEIAGAELARARDAEGRARRGRGRARGLGRGARVRLAGEGLVGGQRAGCGMGRGCDGVGPARGRARRG
jgi:hypothetical protein